MKKSYGPTREEISDLYKKSIIRERIIESARKKDERRENIAFSLMLATGFGAITYGLASLYETTKPNTQEVPEVYETKQVLEETKDFYDSTCRRVVVQTTDCDDLELVIDKMREEVSTPQAKELIAKHELSIERKHGQQQGIAALTLFAGIGISLLLCQGPGGFTRSNTYVRAVKNPYRLTKSDVS